jgi:putative ABC transport system permease protein
VLRNYLKIAYRTLRSRPGVTAINVLGLAVGLAACLLIGLWIKHELSYDDFHPDAEDTYRVTARIKLGDMDLEAPLSAGPMAPMLVNEFSDTEAATRLGTTPSTTVRVGDRSFRESQIFTADSSFFDVFGGFTLRHGDPATALTGSDAVVLTPAAAQRYFGDKNPMGRTLRVGEEIRRVTGVLNPIPSTSHLQFQLIVAQDLPERITTRWTSNNFYTYVRLAEGTDPTAFDQRLDQYVQAEIIPQLGEVLGMSLEKRLTEGAEYQYNLQRLTDIYLHADSSYEAGPTGSLAVVYVFMAVGFFILLIACINFMNLATARASERATEVGIRKAVGAGRPQLAGQFLGEAVLTTTAAFGLALGLAFLARPIFTQLSGVPLSLGDLLNGPVLLALGAGILAVGALAGSYPAFVLARFDPSEVLTVNQRHGSGGGSSWVRRGLVVGQFVVSIALIAGTLVVWQQYDYIQTKQLGLDEERIVVLTPGESLVDRQDAFLKRARRLPGVAAATGADPLFGFITKTSYGPTGASPAAATGMSAMDVGPHFVETMGIDVERGRSFDPGRAADSSAVLLNEAAAKAFGWSSREAVGQTINEPNSSSLKVIGVVDNFHYQSLRRHVQPLVLRLAETGRRMFVRLDAGNPGPALDQLREAWSAVGATGPFQYTFLDQDFAQLHRSTRQAGQLLGLFSGLAIFVACLGLFGLATYTVQRRTKEIGIRKALGATASQVVALVSKQFVALVGAAFVVAAPLAYVGMTRWLSSFAYQTSVGAGVLFGAGGAVLLVALLTVSVHALRAARTDPARALRSE